MIAGVGRPEHLSAGHDVAEFDCGDPVLNAWLIDRAFDNERRGGSRTYVAMRGRRVIGYYSLAAAAVSRHEAPGRARRNMPDPIPAILLGRLALDLREQGKGLGKHLLRDAIARALGAADVVGARVLLVHAATEAAASFYSHFDFEPSPTDPMHLLLPLEDARASGFGP